MIIAYSVIINYYNTRSWNSIATTIGYYILNEYFKKNVYKNDNFYKQGYDNFKKDNNITDLDLIILGDFFIRCFENSNIIIKDLSNNMNDVTYIKIDEQIIDEIKNNLIMTPNSLPMICPPNNWSENEYGGFLDNSYIKNDIYHKKSSNNHSMENKKPIYNSVNYLNNTKFTINNDFLNFITNEGFILLSDPEKKPEQLSKSETLTRTIILKLAETYNNLPFYLTTYADWRGRLYTDSFYLTYQGNELSSAIIQFYEGEPLDDNGFYYFKIYGANLYNENGISKKSYNQRVNWIEANKKKIINLNIEFIMKAENKFLFSAFCLAYKKYIQDNNTKIYTPLFLDATCSGLQHLAGLMKDVTIADKVNLREQTENDNVDDIYTNVMEHVNIKINEYALKNKDYSELSLIKLNRKIIKQPIMTKTYNVSIYGIADQIINIIPKIKIEGKKNEYLYVLPGILNNEVHLSKKYINKIAQIIYNEIFEMYPSLKIIYNYFINISKLMIKLDIPITWFTPAGLKLTQHYLKSKKNKISIKIANKSKTLVLREFFDEIDSRKQSQAIIPNIVHSLDASHLINIFKYAINNKFYPVITIHDCFGTHPNKILELKSIVKQEFIKLYSTDEFLNKFHYKIIETIKDNNYIIYKNDYDNNYYVLYTNKRNKKDEIMIPNLPVRGNLDINTINNSQHMIT